MLDLALDFEKSAIFINHYLLVTAGVVMLIAGLCLWLAGTSKPAIFTAIFTAIVFLTVAGLFRTNFVGKIIIAVLGLAVGGIMPKKAIILSAVITAGIAAIVAIYALSIQPFPEVNKYYSNISQQLNLADSMIYLDSFSSFELGEISKIVKSLTALNIAITAAAMISAGITAIFLTRFITALLCGIWGMLLISKALTLLLLYKGTLVITRFSQDIPLYLTIAAIMLIFATSLQLILCPDAFKKNNENDENEKDGDKK